MLKKIFACVLVLGLLFGCAACTFSVELNPDGSEPAETKPTETEPSVATEEPERTEASTEESTEETAPEESYTLLIPAEEQIALLVANRDLWYPADDYYVPYSYAVTDLDQNGRLELLINICMGTGFFSENFAWEVNETGDGIVSCGEIFETYESQVDLGYAAADAYYDAETDIYYFIAEDYIRNGWAFNATEVYAMSLQNGQMQSRFLGSCSYENFEDGTQNITCIDASKAEITEEVFNVIDETVFADLQAMTVKFLWQAKNIADTDLLDADGWHRILEESWLGFSMEEK